MYEHKRAMTNYHFELMRTAACGLYNEYSKYLQGTQIINGGSILGSPIAFKQLAYYITDKWKGCNDQVVLNVLARASMFENVTVNIHRQGEGVMNVVGWGGEVIRDSNGNFLNSNCLISPVVHQYDIV
jgi:hypothetical protein